MEAWDQKCWTTSLWSWLLVDSKLCICLFACFVLFLGQHLNHMEVLMLGVESELQLLAYTTAAAMPNLSHVCDLHGSSWQHWSRSRDQTCVFMDTSQVLYCWAVTGTPALVFEFKLSCSKAWVVNTGNCLSFYLTHSSVAKRHLIDILICISLMTYDSKTSFHVHIGHSFVVLREMSVQIICPF